MMTVTINGSPRTVPLDTTIHQLLELLEIGRDGTAVAVDRRVIPRTRHAETRLTAGQEIEVIRAVGGG